MDVRPVRLGQTRATVMIVNFLKRACAAIAAAASVAALLSYASPARAAVPGPVTAAALSTMFNGYGDAGNHWTGGDGTTSVALPDGRVAWLFADTFLGTVNAGHTRSRNTPMVNNTMGRWTSAGPGPRWPPSRCPTWP